MSLTCMIEYKGDYLDTVLTVVNNKCIKTNLTGTTVEIQAMDGTTRMYPLDVIHAITTKRTGT